MLPAMDKVQEVVTKAMGMVDSRLGKLLPQATNQPQQQRLSDADQVRVFVHLSPTDLDVLRSKYGEGEVQRYIQAMNAKTRALYG